MSLNDFNKKHFRRASPCLKSCVSFELSQSSTLPRKHFSRSEGLISSNRFAYLLCGHPTLKHRPGLLTCFQHNLSISSFSTLYSIGLADISAISHVESWVVVIFNYSNEIFQTGNKQYCGHHKFISVHNSNMSGMSPSTYCIICWASMSLHLLLLMSSTFDQ